MYSNAQVVKGRQHFCKEVKRRCTYMRKRERCIYALRPIIFAHRVNKCNCNTLLQLYTPIIYAKVEEVCYI